MNAIIKTIFVATILLSIAPAQATVSHASNIVKAREIAQSNHNSFGLLLARLARSQKAIDSLAGNIRQNHSRMDFDLAMQQECDLHCARQDHEDLQLETDLANRVRAEMYPAQR